MIVGEREGTQFKIELPVCLYLYNNFGSVCVLGMLFSNLKECKNSQFWGASGNSQTNQINLEQTTLVCLHPHFSRIVLNMQQYFNNH